MKSTEEIFSTINYYIGRTIYYIYFGGIILGLIILSIHYFGTPKAIVCLLFALSVFLLAWLLYSPILKFNIWASTKIYGVKPMTQIRGGTNGK